MKILNARRAAAQATAATPSRPATAVVYDAPDARMVVFRIAPGQAVAPHRNASTVTLTVLAGSGMVSGSDREQDVAEGDVVAYEPNELHGMRAIDRELILLAMITPRPGSRVEAHALERARPADVSGGA
ncbi:MAG TPA: cupin domain-containing protein [Gemmatimonadaceae bacterium]|nr:cupin domain-containing protein [Gemmatimonadaceae bacterium]